MSRYIYGIHPAREALKAGAGVEVLYVGAGAHGPAAELAQAARRQGLHVETLPRDKLARLAGGGVHQGVILKVAEFAYAELEQIIERVRAAGANGLVLVLDGIEDPHNFGALVRSALALGAQGVVIPKDRAASVTPAAVKSSAGALAHLPVARVTNLTRALERMKEEASVWVVGADMSGDRLPEQVDLKGPIALVVGGEGEGIRRLVLEQCDFQVRIPMTAELASLNASVAGALLLYEVGRQRRGTVAAPPRGLAG